MTCPARNPKLPPTACPEYILGISDSREILRCRACPSGQALMATVRADGYFCELETVCISNTEETSVEKQTYTVKELAVLLGVSTKDVANAKYLKRDNPKPGSKVAAVCDGMLARGITWEQVCIRPRRGNALAALDNAEPAADPAPEFADVVADMEPENDPQHLGPGCCCEETLRPLEDIIADLRHRIPGAVLTIPL